jgi:hypothetical protein
VTSEAATPGRSGTTKLRRLLALVKSIPAEVNLMMWRWIASLHDPIDVGPPTYAWCGYCKTQWPCDPYVSATDVIKSLTGGGSSDRP